MSLDGGRDGHSRRDEMCAASGPLAAFEITIAGRGAALSWLKDVGIHRQTHTAPGFTPLESRFFEQAVQPFLFRLLFHQSRAWHHHGPHSPGDVLTFGQTGCQAKVFDA